jgi:predicted ester cyclase
MKRMSSGRHTAELESLSRRVIDEVLNGDRIGSISKLLDDDLVVHGLGANTDARGLDLVREKLFVWHAAVPDSEDAIGDVIAADDAVVCFCTRRGTLTGEYPGMPPGALGRAFEIAVVHRFRFEDGKVVEWWELADALGMARQLGVLGDSPGDAVRLMVGQEKRRLSG